MLKKKNVVYGIGITDFMRFEIVLKGCIYLDSYWHTVRVLSKGLKFTVHNYTSS